VLNGRRLLMTGVATPDSIAYATARRSLELGAELVLTAFPRDLHAVTELAATLGPDIAVFPLDLTDEAQVDALTTRLRDEVGMVDGALHAVAFAPGDALRGRMTDADPSGVQLAFRTSAWSLTALSRMVAQLAPEGGASIVGLDFDADDRAWPTYNWMGVCKAALRSSARYLARDLGPSRIRVNLVAAGPLRTRAASAIPGFELLTDAWASTAPLRWDESDAEPVADVACFLLSSGSRAMTGEVVHVDGGFHAMAGPLVPPG
jgi:enoyl-[acyl-carrier protein] reductase I